MVDDIAPLNGYMLIIIVPVIDSNVSLNGVHIF